MLIDLDNVRIPGGHIPSIIDGTENYASFCNGLQNQ